VGVEANTNKTECVNHSRGQKPDTPTI